MRNTFIFAAPPACSLSPVFHSPTRSCWKPTAPKCHNDEKARGKFNLKSLGDGPNGENGDLWVTSLHNVEGLDMPPEDESKLSAPDRERLIQFLKQKISDAHQVAGGAREITPRRLNNRELIHSVADVLLIEDVGTHQPTADLVGDALNKGFDTDAETLGISQFQMEQYIVAFRRILDATVFSTGQPATQKYEVKAGHITLATTTQQKAKQKKEAGSARSCPTASISTSATSGRAYVSPTFRQLRPRAATASRFAPPAWIAASTTRPTRASIKTIPFAWPFIWATACTPSICRMKR